MVDLKYSETNLVSLFCHFRGGPFLDILCGGLVVFGKIPKSPTSENCRRVRSYGLWNSVPCNIVL